MSNTQKPRVLIIAGPNGAGKTTFAREFLPHEADCPVFVNADLIAEGLSPFDPSSAAIAAGRLMLIELSKYGSGKSSFAFETTLSGVAYARKIPKWQQSGFEVFLIFLSLQSADDAVNRVAQRVRQGGHDIPEKTIRRRFTKGIDNFRSIYSPLVDGWALYDSSGDTPILLDWAE
jgi:predicted ABC-type ATPase